MRSSTIGTCSGWPGTGSKSLLIKDAFVPAHRAHSMLDYELDERPLNYRFPFAMVFSSLRCRR